VWKSDEWRGGVQYFKIILAEKLFSVISENFELPTDSNAHLDKRFVQFHPSDRLSQARPTTY
jgi:hypothetical protein